MTPEEVLQEATRAGLDVSVCGGGDPFFVRHYWPFILQVLERYCYSFDGMKERLSHVVVEESCICCCAPDWKWDELFLVFDGEAWAKDVEDSWWTFNVCKAVKLVSGFECRIKVGWRLPARTAG